MKFASRLKVTASALGSTTLSAGTVVTLGAAYTDCRTLAQVITDGASDPTAIKVGDTNIPFAFDDGSNWMDAYCTITSSTQITINQIISGSNGTSAVTFAGALPTVYNAVPGDFLRRIPVDTFPTAFSTTVPLTQLGTVRMPRQTVSSNLTFTPAANAVRGAFAEYPMISDGVSTITMPNFTEHESSSGLPTTANVPFTLNFWNDGYTYWWAASKAAVQLAQDVTPPTMTSAAVSNATPSTVTLTASETLDSGFQPAASAFTITGHTVLAVTGMSGATVTLSVSPAFVNGESATVSYTQPASNGLRDLVGNLMATFPTPLAITDSVAPNATAVSLTGPTSGNVNTASTAFTVALSPVGSNYSGTDTVTPSDGGAGGTFSPASVQLTQAAPSATFTYTPSTTGIRTISVTNSGSATTLSNPAGISYTSNSASTEALTIDAISSPKVVGTAFNVTGTWSGSPAPTQLDYRLSDDPANQWTAVSATISSGGTSGTWSFSQTPPSANASRTLSVRDRNSQGVTATSNSYTVNATVPGAPTIGTATAGDTQATVTWTAPASNGGSAITGYTITASPGGATGTAAAGATSGTVTGLADGTAYTFTVHATNSVGNSAESAASNSVTPAVANPNVRLNKVIQNCTESASSPWTYTGTGGSGTDGTVGAVSVVSKPSGVNGAAIFKVNAVANGLMVQIGTSGVVNGYTNNECLWNNGGTWAVIPSGGSVATPLATVAAATGDLLKIEHTNANSAADFTVTTNWSVSKDNGNSWTLLYTKNNGRLLPYYAKVVPAGASVLSCTSATGFA